MRIPHLLLLGALCAAPALADPLAPLPKEQWSAAHAATLLRRAGFGGTPDEIARVAAMSPADAVSWLVDYQRHPASPPLKVVAYDRKEKRARMEIDRRTQRNVRNFLADFGGKGNRLFSGLVKIGARVEAAAAVGIRYDEEEIRRLRSRWAVQMVRTQRPLEEKLTLFWHSHFASGWEKVKDTDLMAMQNETLRRHAAGNFETMLRRIARDPAMLRYLDSYKNVKASPNENFARELMELFTVGRGHYSEQDVEQAARAFTGWTIRRHRDSKRFDFDASRHDNGIKTFLGQRGNFNGDDIITILLRMPQTSIRIATKLLIYFVGEARQPWIDTLARTLRDSKYALKPALRKLFRSRVFYASRARHIKSPAMLLVGTARLLGTSDKVVEAHARWTMVQMGQALFEPVNVKGWDGGRSWINSATMLRRYNMAADLVRRARPDAPLFRELQKLPAETRRARLLSTLVPRALPEDKLRDARDLKQLTLLATSTPEYQLD